MDRRGRPRRSWISGSPFEDRYVERMSQKMVRWDDFVQRVRRHRLSDLLTAIAATNIAIAPDGMWEPIRGGPFFPWALAVEARESIRGGNEHRRAGVTNRPPEACFSQRAYASSTERQRVVRLTPAQRRNPKAELGPDARIFFSAGRSPSGPLHRVSASGGTYAGSPLLRDRP